MRKLRISFDPCNTLFDKSKRQRIGGVVTYPLLPGARTALSWWKLCGHELYAICTIERGKEDLVRKHFQIHGLTPTDERTPWILLEKDVIFCYQEEEKAAIAHKLYRRNLSPIDIHIDSSTAAIKAVDDEVERSILFGADKDWPAIQMIVDRLPK